MRRKIKCSVTRDGHVAIVDPGFDCLLLVKHLRKDFKIESVPPPPNFIPSFQKTRNIRIPGMKPYELINFDTDKLWDIHDMMLRGGDEPWLCPNNTSLLDIKIELAKREIQSCRLCGWACGVNRFKEPGRCGLMHEAYYNSIFIHIAEEAIITPCAVISLSGCALRCRFCQAHESFDSQKGKYLDSKVWDELKEDPNFERSVSLQFVGGNPDESVYTILKSIKSAPDELDKPIVWNNHGYASPIIYNLLEGIVDVWLTDFKYGNNECGQKISGVKKYFDFAAKGVNSIINQNAREVIRILLLPGHKDCCHKKVLQWLSAHKDTIWISLIDNYIPDWKAAEDSNINRTVSKEEIEEVKVFARSCGLRDISEKPEEFWKGDIE